jgi:hypothetical protein
MFYNEVFEELWNKFRVQLHLFFDSLWEFLVDVFFLGVSYVLETYTNFKFV